MYVRMYSTVGAEGTASARAFALVEIGRGPTGKTARSIKASRSGRFARVLLDGDEMTTEARQMGGL